jgi:hypothetical protein
MTKKYTPGPWKISMPHIKPENALGYMLTMSDYPEALADARLIAAAPEMLAALKSAVHYLDGFKGPFNHELLNLKAIIAKAEGK